MLHARSRSIALILLVVDDKMGALLEKTWAKASMAAGSRLPWPDSDLRRTAVRNMVRAYRDGTSHLVMSPLEFMQ